MRHGLTRKLIRRNWCNYRFFFRLLLLGLLVFSFWWRCCSHELIFLLSFLWWASLLKHRDKPTLPQQPTNSLLFNSLWYSSVSTSHHYQVTLRQIKIINILIWNILLLLDLYKATNLLTLKLEHQLYLVHKYFRILLGVSGRLEVHVCQLLDCDGVHFLDVLELSHGRLSMRFLVPNFVISRINIIFVACAIDFQRLQESFKFRKIVFELAADYSLNIENSSGQIAQYQD